MDSDNGEFLPAMIGILERLHRTALNRGEPLLASILDIAKTEAEDALRHATKLAEMVAEREATSSATTWRASPPESWPESPAEGWLASA